MDISLFYKNVSNFLLGWPLVGYVVGVSLICTFAFKFVQFRYFFKAWKFSLQPEQTESKTEQQKVDMTPLQAFLNALSSGLGNGSIAGTATAIASGGPGAAVWLVLTGFIAMSIRFAEVFLSAYAGATTKTKQTIGGPMLYLKQVIFGQKLAYVYALFVFLFGLTGGNAIQTNSISLSIVTTWNVSALVIACCILLFILYVVFGGSARIVKVSDAIVPIKVILFFVSALIVLGYHYQSLWNALLLMISSAFGIRAVVGGAAGFAVQQVIRYGMMRAIFATESGLGTAAILFGSTGSKQPVRTGIMAMLVTFISTMVCFIMSLCIVASGVWNSGATSSALAIASFNTVFGQFGGWVVSFLSISFGIGVLVTFAYITREAWLYLTGGRAAWLHAIIYSTVSFIGAIMAVKLVWDISDIVMASMLIINLFGVLYLLPVIKKELRAFSRKS